MQSEFGYPEERKKTKSKHFKGNCPKPMLLCPLFTMLEKHTGEELNLGGRHRRTQWGIIPPNGCF